ncbi:hypothetical protein LP422_23680 [Janibacter limosus]|nr:hypothetical protein LP422_23680 [Janibacter limosus]
MGAELREGPVDDLRRRLGGEVISAPDEVEVVSQPEGCHEVAGYRGALRRRHRQQVPLGPQRLEHLDRVAEDM